MHCKKNSALEIIHLSEEEGGFYPRCTSHGCFRFFVDFFRQVFQLINILKYIDNKNIYILK